MQAMSSVLKDVENSIRFESPDRAAETLRRVTDLFLNGAGHYSEQQVALFDEVFSRLVEKIEAVALAELSDRLAPVAQAPAGIVRRLASDDAIDVAAPVLTQSPVLTSTDLAAIAENKSQDHLLAISKREEIDPLVTDILVERGNTAVLHSLAGNGGAALSDIGYSRLIRKSQSDAALGELIASRNDISLLGIRRLLKRATQAVCARLLQKVQPEYKRDVHETLLRIFDRVDNDIHRERDVALNAVSALKAEGRLDAKCLFEFCRHEQLAHLTAGLADLSGSSFALVAEVLDTGRNHPLMVVCKAAGIPWSMTFAMLKSRPGQSDIVEFQFDELVSDYCRLSPEIARRALRFWEVRLKQKPADDEPQPEGQPAGRKPRAHARSKIHQAAIVLCPNNVEKPCVMLDISRGGAKLQTVGSVDVPDRFTLTLARNRLIRRNCTVVWRAPKAGMSDRTFGVSFDH
jgi:uncharacterized protein (DUF2336 family)